MLDRDERTEAIYIAQQASQRQGKVLESFPRTNVRPCKEVAGAYSILMVKGLASTVDYEPKPSVTSSPSSIRSGLTSNNPSPNMDLTSRLIGSPNEHVTLANILKLGVSCGAADLNGNNATFGGPCSHRFVYL